MKTGIGRCIGGALGAVLLLGSSVASAAVVSVTGDDGNIARSIFNLDVDGTEFNVNEFKGEKNILVVFYRMHT